MADNHILPAVGDVVRSTENADGSKTQHVLFGIFQSTSNTTTTPLASAATYTGTGEVAPADGVAVSCKTDNSGTLYFDFSPDGTNWDAFPSNGFDVVANVHEYHTAKVNGRYFRVRLVNDAGAQSFLRLYTYFGPHSPPNAPLNQTLGGDSDAIVVRPYDTEIDKALGRLGGVTSDQKFGSVLAVDTADAPLDIWDFASDDLSSRSATKTFPTASGDLFISSDSASDTDVDVTVHYIDATGAAASVEVNLNGQTPVDLGDNGFDVNRAFASGATAAVGNIYINTANAHTGGVPNDLSTVLAFIRAGDGQTEQTSYTVPLGKKAIIRQVSANMQRSSGAAGSAVVTIRTRLFGETWIVKRKFFPTSSIGIFKPVAGLVLPARASIVMRATSISDLDTNILGEFIYDLVDE